MATLFNVYGAAKAVAASESDPATIINVSGGTLYYKNTSAVSTSDSSLANGAKVEVTEPNWVIGTAAAPVKVQILRNEDRDESPYPESREPIRTVDGPMKSGTSGTLAGVAETDTVAYDKSTKTHFVNEGTAASPYWTPVAFTGAGLLGVYDDFRSLGADILGGGTPAITDTGVVNWTSAGSRITGQGIAETDSGIAAGTDIEGAHVARLTTTDEASHAIGLAGHATAEFQPDTHGTIVVDCSFTNVSAITLRTTFCGFAGVLANEFDTVASGSTVTVTHNIDDCAGIFQDVGLTDADGLFLISEKSNTAGTQTVTTTGAGTLPAAGTWTRLRVEVWPDGTTVAFQDKAQIGVIPGTTGAGTHAAGTVALDADEEIIPVFYISSTSAATKSVDVRRFMYWGKRVSA